MPGCTHASVICKCSSWFGNYLIDSAANAEGHPANPGTIIDAQALAALPNAVLFYADALFACRMPPPPALQA